MRLLLKESEKIRHNEILSKTFSILLFQYYMYIYIYKSGEICLRGQVSTGVPYQVCKL